MAIDVWPLATVLGLLFFLFACGVPVAFALGASGIAGIIQIQGFAGAASTIAAIPYNTTSVYTLTVVPMFILMGLLVSHSGMIDGIFNVAQRATRRLPGGLGIATVLAATFFGGISGSSVADAATIGRISIGEMAKRGYEKAYAAAIVAAAGTVDILIPPSIAMVVYGIVSGESIGALMIAGIIPGLLTAAIYIVLIVVLSRGRRDGEKVGDVALVHADEGRKTAYRQEMFGVFGGLGLFAIVIGGLYTGWVTATEAGALGAFTSLFLSVLFVVIWRASRGQALRQMLVGAFSETGGLTSMIFALIVGAAIFTNFLVLANVPTGVSSWILGLDFSPNVIVALLLLTLVPLGMFVDGLSMLLIVGPLFHPVAKALGMDGIWFGIMFIKGIEIGLLTPPLGLNVFVVSGLFPDIRVEDVFRRIAPFIAAEFVVSIILFTFPAIITALPAAATMK